MRETKGTTADTSRELSQIWYYKNGQMPKSRHISSIVLPCFAVKLVT